MKSSQCRVGSTAGASRHPMLGGCRVFGKIQIRISESKHGFSGFLGANPKTDHESIKSTLWVDSSDQIQIRIFETRNLSVFWGKDLKTVFLSSESYTCNHPCYTIYLRFFCHVYLRSFLLCGVFIPKYMTIFLQTRTFYMRTKKPVYMRYKQACVYGVTQSRRIRGTELYHQQTPSCTMELKSNFSLNQAWPQWPR